MASVTRPQVYRRGDQLLNVLMAMSGPLPLHPDARLAQEKKRLLHFFYFLLAGKNRLSIGEYLNRTLDFRRVQPNSLVKDLCYERRV